jgi:peptidoglycan glycosyltransferase
MRKLEKRAILCLVLAGILFVGVGIYSYRVVRYGGDWVSFQNNQDVYTNGYIAKGAIYDVNGKLLLQNNKTGTPKYNSSLAIREATLHTVGDSVGNIATGANRVFADKLVGYNLLSGTFSTSDKGRQLYLTIDSKICAAANSALAGRKGCVGVYNYKTGDIICMVSSPNYDPEDPPKNADADENSGIYMNKLLNATVVPGSIFKVITSTAAIEKLGDINSWSYYCTGTHKYGTYSSDKVTCTEPHGYVNFRSALAKSCNCGFADITLRLGMDTLKEYVKKSGLTTSYSVNGIRTTPSSFEFPSSKVTEAWTGIGQYKDLVNPCSMMVYMGAVANGGKSVEPKIISSLKFSNGMPADFDWTSKTDELIKASTAKKLRSMLRNDVISNYGQANFPGLKLYAKSGTAELGNGKQPHSWFTGFIKNPGYPYAFIVLVENGGWGSETAGSVANTVLQKVVATDPSDN